MAGIRKKYNRDIRLRVVLALLKGDKSLAQLSSEFGVHTTQIKEWRDQGMDAMKDRFSTSRGRKKDGIEDKYLYEEIGRFSIRIKAASLPAKLLLPRCKGREYLCQWMVMAVIRIIFL